MTRVMWEETVCTGEVTIGGVFMHTPAWAILDVTPFWLPAEVRGSDRLLPGVTGVRAYRRRRTVTERQLQLVIIGEFDHTGAENANPWAGARDNVDYLRDNVIDPTNVGDGTRACHVELPDGALLDGNIHVLGLERDGPLVDGGGLYTMTISIPLGVLTETVGS